MAKIEPVKKDQLNTNTLCLIWLNDQIYGNIFIKDSISFKNLEENTFKIACKFANKILRRCQKNMTNK